MFEELAPDGEIERHSGIAGFLRVHREGFSIGARELGSAHLIRRFDIDVVRKETERQDLRPLASSV